MTTILNILLQLPLKFCYDQSEVQSWHLSALESASVAAVTVSLSADFPLHGRPIHRRTNKISISPVTNQIKVQPISSLHRRVKNIHL
jgi:hypothetical protein